MSVAYTAVLPVRESTVAFLADLIDKHRRRPGARLGGWALTAFDQSVMALRWFLDGTRIAQLAVDNNIGKTTAYDYLNDVVDLLAAQAPSLNAALLAAKAAGHPHISIDGSVFDTTRCSEAGPTVRKGSTTGRRVDLWWSGKHHHHHGGNIQVITAPDGWPLWTSPVRPGREHDTKALRTHPELLPALELWTGEGLPVLADLGYEGEAATITTATKTPTGGALTDEQKTANKTHNGKRAVGERGNALLKETFKGLRRISLCPWRIGKIVAAALVLLHIEHDRTT